MNTFSSVTDSDTIRAVLLNQLKRLVLVFRFSQEVAPYRSMWVKSPMWLANAALVDRWDPSGASTSGCASRHSKT